MNIDKSEIAINVLYQRNPDFFEIVQKKVL